MRTPKPSRAELELATASLALTRPDLELLLLAGTAEPERARGAWNEWVATQNLDDIDIHAMKLLPRVVRRLPSLGLESKHTRKHFGIAKYLWLKSEVTLQGGRAAAQILKKSGIETIAIKGLALRALGLVSPLERPMVDTDLVLRNAGELGSALKLLRINGWHTGLMERHALSLTKDHAELDLHSYPLKQDPSFPTQEWLRRDRPSDPFEVLDDTALFLVACLHGMTKGAGAIWILDAQALALGGKVNWDAISYYAKTRALTLTLATALSRVEGAPERCVADLRSTPVSHIEALELRHLMTGAPLGADAARLLDKLRREQPIVNLGLISKYEESPGFRWDSRWVKEWSTP